jgi:hypothetical protein
MLLARQVTLQLRVRSPWLPPRTRPTQQWRLKRPVQRRHNSHDNKPSNSSPPANESLAETTLPGSVPIGATPKPIEPREIQQWYHRLGLVSDFFRWFHRTQTKHPYRVQLGTTLTTYLCGDLLAQDIGGEKYDGWRTVRMLTIGAVAAVPGYKWYLYGLERHDMDDC